MKRRVVMERRKNLRDMMGVLKDKASLLRTALLFTCSASASSRLAVLRATSHASHVPPPDHHVGALLALGQRHRLGAAICLDALMDRLHRTRNASVALKCLIVLHGAASAPSSSPLRNQLASFPSSGGRNFLNLSGFRDDSAPEISAWVRWFAGVLELNLTAARVLGKFAKKRFHGEKANSEILREIDSLGNLVEQVCEAPESLHLQRNDLVYEIVMLAGDDYGLAQREIAVRVAQLGDRVGDLSPDESGELTRALQRLQDYKERLGLLLVNRKRNDAFWEMIGRTKAELLRRRREREGERRIVVAAAKRDESSELTRYGARVAGRPEQLFRLPAGGSSWLDVDRMALTVSAVG